FNKDVDIVFIGVHTDDGSVVKRRNANRPLQAAAIVDYIKDIDIPVIVAGNFFFKNEGDDALPTILTNELTSVCKPCEATVNQHGSDFIADHIMYKNLGSNRLLDFKVGAAISSRKPAIAEFKIIEEKD